jgi:hypothetical protein
VRPPLTLAPDAELPERPFTHPARTQDDLAALAAIRTTLGARVVTASRKTSWRAADGAQHWIVVPDRDALVVARPAAAVGFFGQAREDVDHEPIVELEHDLLSRADRFDGLLAYHNVRFADGQWGNLVVFADQQAPDHVREDAVHGAAIARTPHHYHSLRLHRATLPGGVLGAEPIQLLRTSYYDFAEDPPWRAVREAAPALD